jgi:hypothetical protein
MKNYNSVLTNIVKYWKYFLQCSKALETYLHTTWTVRNNYERLECKDEASFDSPFMIQSHDKSMKKIVVAL